MSRLGDSLIAGLVVTMLLAAGCGLLFSLYLLVVQLCANPTLLYIALGLVGVFAVASAVAYGLWSPRDMGDGDY
jgi:hypothetical protein